MPRDSRGRDQFSLAREKIKKKYKIIKKNMAKREKDPGHIQQQPDWTGLGGTHMECPCVV